jgi:hypothetical protein
MLVRFKFIKPKKVRYLTAALQRHEMISETKISLERENEDLPLRPSKQLSS